MQRTKVEVLTKQMSNPEINTGVVAHNSHWLPLHLSDREVVVKKCSRKKLQQCFTCEVSGGCQRSAQPNGQRQG